MNEKNVSIGTLRVPGTEPAVKHGFKAVECNGVTYELSCKCGQIWAARNKALLLECFDAHINIYEG